MFHQEDQLGQKRRQRGIQKTGNNKCIDLQNLQSILEQKLGGLQESSLQEKKKESEADKLKDSVTEWKIFIR